MFCSTSIYPTHLRWQEVTEEHVHYQRALPHGTMQKGSSSPGRLQLESAGNDFITSQHQVALMAASEQLISESSDGSLWGDYWSSVLQNVWFSYHPCSESQFQESTVPKCWWWHLQVFLSYVDRGCATQTLWTNQCERVTPLRMAYLKGEQNQLLLCEQFQACPQLPVSFLVTP